MVHETRGSAATPADWVDAAAIVDPDRPALVMADGVVTYGQLRDLIHARVASVTADIGTGDVVPVPVRPDLPSIVELLALPAAAVVPLPYSSTSPAIPVRSAPGTLVCVATSGSGGRRRIVPLTMDNVSAAAVASRARLGTGPEDRWLLTLPLDHVGGLSVLYRSVEAGGTVVVSRFDDRDLLRVTKPTVASVVPTMVHRLLRDDADILAAIGTVLVGGGPLRLRVLDASIAAGVRIVPTYGTTETSSQVATAVPGSPVPHPGYVGPPLDHITLEIDDAGAIAVEGPSVFGGYLGEPPRIAAHRTGDLGRWESDGGLTVLGRADDLVTSGGENVSLNEVADRIEGLAGVADVAVVAVDDDEWGSAVCALVETSLATEAVEERIESALSGPMRPRRIRTTDVIPLLSNGKHDLTAIRALFEEA